MSVLRLFPPARAAVPVFQNELLAPVVNDDLVAVFIHAVRAAGHIVHVEKVAHFVVVRVVAPDAAGRLAAVVEEERRVRQRVGKLPPLRRGERHARIPEKIEICELGQNAPGVVLLHIHIRKIERLERGAFEQRRNIADIRLEHFEIPQLLELRERGDVGDRTLGDNEIRHARHVLQKAQVGDVHVADVQTPEIGAVFPAVDIVIGEIDLVFAPRRGDEIFGVGAQIIVAEVDLPDDADVLVFPVERIELLVGEVRVAHIDLRKLRKLRKRGFERGDVSDRIVVQIDELGVPRKLLPLDRDGPPGGNVRVLLNEREPVGDGRGAAGQLDRAQPRQKIERGGELRERGGVLAGEGKLRCEIRYALRADLHVPEEADAGVGRSERTLLIGRERGVRQVDGAHGGEMRKLREQLRGGRSGAGNGELGGREIKPL